MRLFNSILGEVNRYRYLFRSLRCGEIAVGVDPLEDRFQDRRMDAQDALQAS